MAFILPDETKHLEKIIERLKDSLAELDETVSRYENEYKESMKYLWENRSGMDKMEIFSNEKSVSQIVNAGESIVKRRIVIEKLIESPYFARIDFKHDGENEEELFYIGRYSYIDRSANMLIYDWRAPIAGMYYDFELGPAFYKAPFGMIKGEITLKRQYKIKNGIMEYALESSISINDEVLQKELSHTSDQKMKNIVATIQKEQNQIIRNEKADVLVIQGVAGSGKTSIALHRVAYLLYKNKDQLAAHNIMIISPNRVFADYISNVLPELGEEPVTEAGFEDIAAELLDHSIRFESYVEQMEAILEDDDPEVTVRIKYKSSLEFLLHLDEYLEQADENYFCPCDCTFGKVTISKELIQSKYTALKSKPMLQRIDELTGSIIGKLKLESGAQKLPGKRDIQKQLTSMLKVDNTLAFYSQFFEYIGRPDLLVTQKGDKLEATDIYPYIYLKIYFEGINEFTDIKHILIDEMQDYTPVQYAVIKKLFRCKKTILGDFGQTLNPYNSISHEVFTKLYEKTELVELTKSYRSTYEIIRFAQKIQDHSIDPIERHGDEPEVISCKDKSSEISVIDSIIEQFKTNSYSSVGIICKSSQQAGLYYKELSKNHQVSLMDFNSSEFTNGITITTIHMAKGLEFDQVILPSVNAAVYKSEHDKSLLYIACTRAMHKLTLTYHGDTSTILPDLNELGNHYKFLPTTERR